MSEVKLGLRHVRTPEGARRFGLPVGAPIVPTPVPKALRELVNGETPLYHSSTKYRRIRAGGFALDQMPSPLSGGGTWRGVYLTPDKAAARFYGGRGSGLVEASVRLKRPFVWDERPGGAGGAEMGAAMSAAAQRRREAMAVPQWDDTQEWNEENSAAFDKLREAHWAEHDFAMRANDNALLTDELQRRGYDGVVHVIQPEGEQPAWVEVVAFDPKDVRVKEPPELHDPPSGGPVETPYVPDAGAPEKGEWASEPYIRAANDPLGLLEPAPKWRQDHDTLVRNAMHSLKGNYAEVHIHMGDELAGADQPSSGSGKMMRAQAAALLWELEHRGRPNPKTLYRGATDDATGVSAWSERRAVANHWARKGGGTVRTLPPGKGRGLRVADYVSSQADVEEREWVMLPDDWRDAPPSGGPAQDHLAPPPQPGALVYRHPQGAIIYVNPDGSMEAYNKLGKKKSTSATPDKLAEGHGGWYLAGAAVDEHAPPPPPDVELEVTPAAYVPKPVPLPAAVTFGAPPPGTLVYRHPQGATAYVLPDGSMAAFTADGKKKQTSATPEKLAAGHGGWELVQPVPTAAVVPKLEEEVEEPSKPAPPQFKHEKPMKFVPGELGDLMKYVNDDNVVFQQKLDGIRGQLVVSPNQAPWFRSASGGQLVSGTAAKTTLPLLVKLPPAGEGTGYVVDGEVLNGKFYVFDLVVDGHEKLPYEQRLTMADAWTAHLAGAGVSQVAPVPTARTPDEKRRMHDALLAGGAEGVMAKRRDAPYTPDKRVTHSVKLKFTSTADVIVTAKNTGGHENYEIAMVGADGKLVNMGSTSALGKVDADVGDVIEVRYLSYDGPGGHLVQPTMLRKRPEKQPADATLDQLRTTNKGVFDASVWAETKSLVRTPEGARRFDQPVGSVIVADVPVAVYDALMPRRGGWTTQSRAHTLAAIKAEGGPDGRVLAETLTQFQRTGSIARLRSAIAGHVSGTPNERARVLIDALRGIDPARVPASLHRGMAVRGSPTEVVDRLFAVGGKFDSNLSSYSTDRKLAESFAGGKKGWTRVVIELVGEKQALPLENLAPSNVFAEEKEWATAGKFEVVEVKVAKVKLRSWERRKWVDSGDTADAVLVKVRQVSGL